MATEISVKTNVKVTFADFQKHVNLYAAVMGKSVAEIIKHTARMFCQDMLRYTPPFSGKGPSNNKKDGIDATAKKKGKDNVDRDIRKIFAPLAQAHASTVADYGDLRIFSAWITSKRKLPEPHQPEYIFKMIERRGVFSQGEFDYFKRVETMRTSRWGNFILGTTESTIKSIHEERRGEPSYKVKYSDKTEINYVDDWRIVENYIKRVQARVGKLKSGWYYAGLELGKMPDVPWVSAQPSSFKICVKQLSGDNQSITVGSTIGRNYSQGYSLMTAAMNHRAYVMRKEMLRFLKDPKNHGTLEEVIRRIPQGYNLLQKDE